MTTPTLSELVDEFASAVLLRGGCLSPKEREVYQALRAQLRARPGVDAEPVIRVCCGEYATCTRPCTPRGRWLAGGHPCDTNAIPAPPTQGASYTYGHCENRKQIGGCHLHNLHCGYPDCDRRAAPPAQPAEPSDALRLVANLEQALLAKPGPQTPSGVSLCNAMLAWLAQLRITLTRPPSAQKEK